jgi:hypothetical protein
MERAAEELGELMNRKKYPDQGIVDRLNEVLTAQGSDSQWARNLGCQRKTVLAYRHGVSDMPLSFLKAVCGATGVRADWILRGGREKYHGEVNNSNT